METLTQLLTLAKSRDGEDISPCSSRKRIKTWQECITKTDKFVMLWYNVRISCKGQTEFTTHLVKMEVA